MSRRGETLHEGAGELVSLFSGAGGFDLGFEQIGFKVAAAVDLRRPSIDTYNHNRTSAAGHVADVTTLNLSKLDRLAKRRIDPIGLIGGPPCQSFSTATHSADDDHRHELPLEFARLLRKYNNRKAVSFFAFENVPGLLKDRHRARYKDILDAFSGAGFAVRAEILNASSFGVAQNRRRLILVGFNRNLFPDLEWTPPKPTHSTPRTVRSVIGKLCEPRHWERNIDPVLIPLHRNHWCMVPKSKNFKTPGALLQGTSRGRSFRTLDWKRPSPTIAYGNREVHVHPSGLRRLSIYEALLLQGFPQEYVLLGNLSAQITQVSEAVPPPLARAIAASIKADLERYQGSTSQAA